MSSAQTITSDARYSMPTFARYPVSFVSGSGVRLIDEEGREYLDMLSGIGVNALGHSNPELAAIYAEQAATLIHISNLYHNPLRVELEKKLVELSAQDMQVFLSNSGAEANECAIKLTRRYASKKGREGKILSLKRSFHGRTLATAAATGNQEKAELYAPVMPGFEHLAANDYEALQTAFEEPVIAFMAEVILGEAGVYELEEAYLKRAAELCKEQGALFIIDEVQTGIARTGSFFAHQAFGLSPDIFTLGKALGNGFPIAATLAKQEVAAAFEPGDHGTTMGGNPLGAAVALKLLNLVEEHELCGQAHMKGDYLRAQLQTLEQVSEIRGRGLMRGISFKPELGINCKELAADLLVKEQILVNAPNESDLRVLPPFIITNSEIDEFIAALKSLLSERNSHDQ